MLKQLSILQFFYHQLGDEEKMLVALKEALEYESQGFVKLFESQSIIDSYQDNPCSININTDKLNTFKEAIEEEILEVLEERKN